MLRQPDAVTGARQRTRDDHLVDDRSEGGVVQEQGRRSAVPGGLAGRGSKLGDHRIHTRVSPKRLAPMNPAQGRKKATFRQTPLDGVDRS